MYFQATWQESKLQQPKSDYYHVYNDYLKMSLK